MIHDYPSNMCSIERVFDGASKCEHVFDGGSAWRLGSALGGSVAGG
jgi:hypothetical protein